MEPNRSERGQGISIQAAPSRAAGPPTSAMMGVMKSQTCSLKPGNLLAVNRDIRAHIVAAIRKNTTGMSCPDSVIPVPPPASSIAPKRANKTGMKVLT